MWVEVVAIRVFLHPLRFERYNILFRTCAKTKIAQIRHRWNRVGNVSVVRSSAVASWNSSSCELSVIQHFSVVHVKNAFLCDCYYRTRCVTFLMWHLPYSRILLHTCMFRSICYTRIFGEFWFFFSNLKRQHLFIFYEYMYIVSSFFVYVFF